MKPYGIMCVNEALQSHRSDDFDDLNDPKAPLEQQLACKAYCNLRQEVLSFSCFDNIEALFEESENES